MRKLLITLDENLSKKLAEFPNQSEVVRKALNVYIADISTDDVASIKKSYIALKNYMVDKFDSYDKSFSKLEKLINYLEERM